MDTRFHYDIGLPEALCGAGAPAIRRLGEPNPTIFRVTEAYEVDCKDCMKLLKKRLVVRNGREY